MVEHFAHVSDMVSIGYNSKRSVGGAELSWYVCHPSFEVGKKVRQTIKELGGTMPENLPAVESVKESKKRLRKPVSKLLLQ